MPVYGKKPGGGTIFRKGIGSRLGKEVQDAWRIKFQESERLPD